MVDSSIFLFLLVLLFPFNMIEGYHSMKIKVYKIIFTLVFFVAQTLLGGILTYMDPRDPLGIHSLITPMLLPHWGFPILLTSPPHLVRHPHKPSLVASRTRRGKRTKQPGDETRHISRKYFENYLCCNLGETADRVKEKDFDIKSVSSLKKSQFLKSTL